MIRSCLVALKVFFLAVISARALTVTSYKQPSYLAVTVLIPDESQDGAVFLTAKCKTPQGRYHFFPRPNSHFKVEMLPTDVEESGEFRFRCIVKQQPSELERNTAEIVNGVFEDFMFFVNLGNEIDVGISAVTLVQGHNSNSGRVKTQNLPVIMEDYIFHHVSVASAEHSLLSGCYTPTKLTKPAAAFSILISDESAHPAGFTCQAKVRHAGDAKMPVRTTNYSQSTDCLMQEPVGLRRRRKYFADVTSPGYVRIDSIEIDSSPVDWCTRSVEDVDSFDFEFEDEDDDDECSNDVACSEKKEFDLCDDDFCKSPSTKVTSATIYTIPTTGVTEITADPSVAGTSVPDSAKVSESCARCKDDLRLLGIPLDSPIVSYLTIDMLDKAVHDLTMRLEKKCDGNIENC